MRTALLASSFLAGLLIQPAMSVAQTEKADTPEFFAPATNYELAGRRAIPRETTGAAPETEAIRNEQPVLIERPEPKAPAPACIEARNASRVCDR